MALQDRKIGYNLLFSNLLLDPFSGRRRVWILMDQQWVHFYSAFSQMTLEQGMCNQIFKFADVTEVFQAVKCDTDGEKPQEDITKLKY